jgi:tetratricopeptide (TPR) repeat protein
MNEASRPSAQGSLTKTPFAHLVLYLYQRRSSGTLIVHTRVPAPGNQTKVLFHRGRAVAANLAQPSAALDQGLLPLCEALDGQFEFHESDLVGSGPGIATGMFDPLAFVAEAARRHVRPELVEEVNAKFARATLALQPAMDLTRLSLTEAEARFAEPLNRGPVTFEDLLGQGELEPAAGRRLMYVLLITKVAGLYDPASADGFQRSAPPEGRPAPESAANSSKPAGRGAAPPSDRSRNSGEAWRAIAARAAEMATNRPPSGSASPIPRSPTPPPNQTPQSGPGPLQQRPPGSTPETPQPSAGMRPPRRSVTEPLDLQSGAASRPATPPPGSRPVTPESRHATRPLTPVSRGATRPFTPAPKAEAPPTSAPAAGSRPVSRPVTPESRAATRPLSPAPKAVSPVAGARPQSRPLTPANFTQSAGSSRPVSRPLSRPLTPTNFTSTPSPLPRVSPSAPISRVTPRPSQPDLETLDASGKFKRVEQLCLRNAFDEALPIIRALVEEDRKNAKYLGMLSHVLLGRTTDGQIGKDIVETVNLALRIDTDEIRALYTKARCYKRMGKEREALHYFKRTVAVEPNHLDATREIRLLMLRLSEKRKR